MLIIQFITSANEAEVLPRTRLDSGSLLSR